MGAEAACMKRKTPRSADKFKYVGILFNTADGLTEASHNTWQTMMHDKLCTHGML